MREVREATVPFMELAKAGRLPSVPLRGNVTTELSLQHTQAVAYPFAVTFLVNESGESFTNHYTLIRPRPDAAWQPGKSWRTDSKGRTVKEWPAK